MLRLLPWLESLSAPLLSSVGLSRSQGLCKPDSTRRLIVRNDSVQGEAPFKVLFDSNPLPMWIYDRENLCFLDVNNAAVVRYGYSREKFLSMTILDIRPTEHRNELKEIIDAGGYEFEDRIWHHCNANRTIITVTVYTHELVHEGREAAVVAVVDVTERRQAEARIIHMAHHDSMTGLANRTQLRHRLTEALTRVRYGGRIAVLYLDLDHFKDVNDALGHIVGDKLLMIAADRLRGCVRADDTVARLGGDEFAIIQRAVNESDDADALAKRIVDVMGTP